MKVGFSLQGYDLALYVWGPTATVIGKAISLSQPLTKQKDALSSNDKDYLIDQNKIVDYAVLNTNFRMAQRKQRWPMARIEGELNFRNLQ